MGLEKVSGGGLGWRFGVEIIKENTGPKCKILLRLLTILKCEFRESPLTGKNLMKVMRWDGLSNERLPGNGFSVFVGGVEVGQRKH